MRVIGKLVNLFNKEELEEFVGLHWSMSQYGYSLTPYIHDTIDASFNYTAYGTNHMNNGYSYFIFRIPLLKGLSLYTMNVCNVQFENTEIDSFNVKIIATYTDKKYQIIVGKRISNLEVLKENV